jgi:hypothetical protein
LAIGICHAGAVAHKAIGRDKFPQEIERRDEPPAPRLAPDWRA